MHRRMVKSYVIIIYPPYLASHLPSEINEGSIRITFDKNLKSHYFREPNLTIKDTRILYLYLATN